MLTSNSRLHSKSSSDLNNLDSIFIQVKLKSKKVAQCFISLCATSYIGDLSCRTPPQASLASY
ncbi:hypothetical protein BpHYR1_021856 [Brachionus plicatilis]|uniref:Uncharacterized protein n=1 Tax=Brachionus plicatilis TaxID=10195 RepID=A0A3M7T3Z6_BRAPC|nr:hypothetical protein BpHYR1_021856 [Brachionus plicatilis]